MNMTTTPPPPSTATPPPSPPPSGSRRSGLWVVLALVVLVALGAGAVATTAWLIRDVDRGSTTVASVDTIRFRGDAAELTLVEADRGDVEVAWETRTAPWQDAQVDLDVVAGVLEVTADCADTFFATCSTGTTITVPSGSLSALDVAVDVGALWFVGTSADVVASTDVGEITAEDHLGTRAVLRTGVGSVEVDAATVPSELDVQVRVGGIAISIPEAEYDVGAATDVGTVATSVRQVDGAPHRVAARTVVGDVDVHMR